MAKNDILIYDEAAFGYPGDETYGVGASATGVFAGEPVVKALGGSNVAALATNKPVVATDFLAGVAASDSNQTATADGIVRVTKLVPGLTWLISPNVAATWNTQSKYDQLVGDRVLLDLTSGSYTILASDGATSGCVIMPLDISKFPGKVRFAFRNGCSYLT